MIIHEKVNNVAVLKLNRGVTNPFNLEMVRTLSSHLQELKADPQVRGLVITSANEKFFSIGFDLPELVPLDRAGFKEFFCAFNRMCLDLYAFPKPTVAALTGHAVAGGCVLALFCDYRIISEGKKLMGLNEIKLGVPVPYAADCVLRHVVGERHSRHIMDSGDFFPPEELAAMGLADQVLPLDQVLTAATGQAASLGSASQQAFRMIKANRIEQVQACIQSRLAEKENYFIDCWFSEEARKGLEEALKNF